MANEENQAAPGNRPVGPQLKQAREAKGLSVAEVADAQHLRPAIIQAIENGKYELIDTELFLKGYIRAYARQVGLDGNALIADLNVELEPMRQAQAQAKAANPLIDIERRRRKKRRVAKAALWLVALAVLGFLVFSFIYNPSQLASLTGAGDDSTTQSTPDNLLPDETSDGDVSASSANAEGALEPLIAAGTGTFSDGEAPADGSGSSPAQTVGNSAVIVDNDRSTIDTEQAPQVADNRGRLEIEFIDDCWVQIRDAYGRSLASGLKRQSDRIDLRAETDIRLVIGAANAIGAMRFEGAPVDLGSKGIVGNRAEFVLALN
ncbi:RodZ domain-containing protein [Marinobacter gelidimuriae]|uniref:RodZ domain-containing protein n=1 Tax=Marinobacter gelidimuriae TaxID=2739064 RepID=UPI00036F0DEB|nr:RodZ domain-containing protein [Marinobacter gelidimuriae]